MPKRMLVDASHPEETRVVVFDGNRVEEFDFEAASKRPLKGNIYLAKVTRVEPSLQAAFVEYGGNRQGFLAFSEIHPDYYQIPYADRQALIAEQEAEARRRSEDDIESFEMGAKRDDSGDEKEESGDEAEEEISAEDDEGTVLDAATIGIPVEDSAVPEAREDRPDHVGRDEVPVHEGASLEDGHDDIFINHGSVEDNHEEDDQPDDISKSEAGHKHHDDHERHDDYAHDGESLEAIAAEENEG